MTRRTIPGATTVGTRSDSPRLDTPRSGTIACNSQRASSAGVSSDALPVTGSTLLFPLAPITFRQPAGPDKRGGS